MIAASDVLKKHSFFGGLLEDQINHVVSLMVTETYPSGTCIITEGSPNDRIYFILEGFVSVLKSGTIINEIPEGNVFGEMEILDIMPSSATIKAKTNVLAMSMSNAAIRRIYKDDVKLFALMMMNLARDISRRLRQANEQLSQLLS